jgi:NAD(P)H-flavin reductase
MLEIPKKYISKVLEKELLSSHFIRVVLQRPEGFLYLAGHYISLVVGEGVRRPYSISNWVNRVDEEDKGNSGVELLIDTKPQGPGSKFVENLKVADTVEFLGPYGKFVVPEDIYGNIWFLGTGSGVAPLKAQIEYLLEEKEKAEGKEGLEKVKNVRLLFGTRHEQDLVFFEHFVGFARAIKSFYYQIALSQPSDNFDPQNIDKDKEARWGEYWHKGYITDIAKDLLKREKPNFVFLCGHPDMMEAAIKLFIAFGVDRKNILFEKFS